MMDATEIVKSLQLKEDHPHYHSVVLLISQVLELKKKREGNKEVLELQPHDKHARPTFDKTKDRKTGIRATNEELQNIIKSHLQTLHILGFTINKMI